MNQRERRTYLPLVLITEAGVPEISGDWLSAAYVDLADQQFSYTTTVLNDTDVAAPDALAYRYYKDSSLWWVIAAFNGVVDPYEEWAVGVTMRVPALDEVLAYLQRVSAATSSQTLQLVDRTVGSTGEI